MTELKSLCPFVQIVAISKTLFSTDLYALDENGNVWLHGYEIGNGGHHFWTRIPDEDRRG